MKKDPAIEEIRAVRMKISKRFGHDTKALLDHYRELEKEYAGQMLPRSNSAPRSRSPQKTTPANGPKNSKSTS